MDNLEAPENKEINPLLILLNESIGEWNFSRSETLELLGVLNDQQLQLKHPGEGFQPLFYQFNCIGRTQLVYAEAIKKWCNGFFFVWIERFT